MIPILPLLVTELIKLISPKLGVRLLSREGKPALAAVTPVLPFVIPLVSFCAVAIGLGLASPHVGSGFFRTAATVIPTLMLTLAVQSRFFAPDLRALQEEITVVVSVFGAEAELKGPWAAFIRVYSALLLMALIGGEATALIGVAVSGSSANSWLFGFSFGGVVAALQAIIYVALRQTGVGTDGSHERGKTP